MSSARDTILARIRNTLQREEGMTPDIAIDTPLRQPTCGPQPSWDVDDVSRFIHKLENAAGTVSRISSEEEVVPAIIAYLEQHDIPFNLVSASSDLLNKLAWPDEFTVAKRKATGSDITVLTEAHFAVAETGSLVLLSGAESPTSLNFLPDNYLCVLRKERLVKHIEGVWQKLRQEQSGLPRAINFITGPSRTADVEQTIQLGAHGPRRLQVFFIE